MSIDDLAHEAELEASVLRLVSHLTAAKAERFLIALAFKIRQATPETKPVDWRLVRGDPPRIETFPLEAREGYWPPLDDAGKHGDIRDLKKEMNADPRCEIDPPLGELSQRIVDFLERAGGTSTMGGIKDACATSKWSRNRVGTEVFNLVHRGTIVRLIALPEDEGRGDFYRLQTVEAK